MSVLSATSYSSTLPLPQFPAKSHWSILSSHRHACNVLAADGTLVALVSATHGNGPFHIIVPQMRFEQLPPAAQVRWQETQVQLGQSVIDLRTATPWYPRLPHLLQRPSGETLGRIAKLATPRSALYSGSMALTGRAHLGIQDLRQGILQRDHLQIEHGIELLAGLGPGLTPAGDDFLVGVLAALWTQQHADTCYALLCVEIATAAAARTTKLSGAWLTCAGRGELGEPWHKLVKALNQQDQAAVDQAVRTILKSGATSGADALCGFFTGIRLTALPLLQQR